ncbi:cold shock domain-containing protein [Marinobacter sediminum]|uniref:cold-shock protein n=1 Tax=Marinobacter sediminum TaxID=256323 RepID=UPI002548BF57|nr:cold shock domain-containing protein [Marinobacter sediminum]MCM0611465.1 cold shock domain-containing protein [Marinobacter sediminum]
MRNPAKAILVAIMIAIPAPFILGFLLVSFTPELFQILSQSQTNELASNTSFVLGSAQGIAAYIIALVIFALAGFLAIALSAKQKNAQRSSSGAGTRSQNQKQQQNQSFSDDDEGDYDENSPEGDEEGTVKWFNVKKGFGFIVRDSGDEVFVHFRAIRGRGRRVLRQGQLVRFSVVEADKGLQADNVSILSD